MREFFYRGRGEQEDEYQAWLDAHPDGLVLSLNQNDSGKYTLHRSRCRTISYAQLGTGHSSRTGKICCDTEGEFEQWLEANVNEGHVGYDRFCKQCPRS